ncbi:hypothetical protein [Methanolobus sp. WCC5]
MSVKIFNDNGMIWAIEAVWNDDIKPIVKFYDCRHEHTDYGQFVAEY